jgi:hypothetical protein
MEFYVITPRGPEHIMDVIDGVVIIVPPAEPESQPEPAPE